MTTEPSFSPRNDVPRLIAHRGASADAPENTLAAFEIAARLGARWVELDAMLCGDGTPVVIHDETLKRTTGIAGEVSRKTVEDLRTLDAGSWFGPAFAGARIPTLEEAVMTIARLGLGANVEIKPAEGFERETGETVARFLTGNWPASLAPPVVSSFSREALLAAHAAAPAHDYAPLFSKLTEGWAERIVEVGGAALHCSARHLTKPQAAAIHESGAALRCYTVNDTKTAQKLFDWGVTSIFSDHADLQI